MTYSCSQCEFVAQFESALKMHQQLHHERSDEKLLTLNGTSAEKSKTMPRSTSPNSIYSSNKYNKGSKLLNRTSSATRLFDKLRSRICRSRTSLTVQPEENGDHTYNELSANDTSVDVRSEGTSKFLKRDVSRISAITTIKEIKEIYSCHLCTFDADRITVLDRHLLNDHKIGLETLLKLVMAKTRKGLTEALPPTAFGIRQPYYNNTTVDLMEEGEFMIETVAPKVKILKNSATNTNLKMTDIPNLKDNCQMITKELEKLMTNSEKCGNEDFLGKMQTLNEYMCRFVNSSNTLKKTLTKEFGSKNSVRERLSGDQQLFELSLAETDSPREWERCHSEKIDRSRNKYPDNNRGDKKLVAESFYF